MLLSGHPIVPLFHQTSVLLVHDDSSVLAKTQQLLRGQFECLGFSGAVEALAFIRSGSASPPPAGKAETELEYIQDPTERRLHSTLTGFPKLFADGSRFGRASVVVAASDLPGPAGLDFLEALRGTPIAKLILLPADPNVPTLRALEIGLADAACPSEALASQLARCQLAYFQRLAEPYAPMLASSDARFLHDPAFAQVFSAFRRDYGIIEHCVLMQPPGILGLDASGNPAILLIADDDYRQASFEIALVEQAPPELLRRLLPGTHLASFPTASGFYSPEMGECWDDYVWPGTPFGSDRRRWAVIDMPDVLGQVCGPIASYADHRRGWLN